MLVESFFATTDLRDVVLAVGLAATAEFEEDEGAQYARTVRGLAEEILEIPAMQPSEQTPALKAPKGLPPSLTDMDGGELKRLCRFDYAGLTALNDALDLPDSVKLDDGRIMPSIYALAILLARFASPASLFTLSQIFHYDVPTLSRCVNMMSKLIYERWHHLLDFDPARLPPSKLDLYANAFANKGCPSNRIWGAIDCTIIPISRPGRKQQVSYNGYKKQHATKYQGVTTPDGLIALCFGPVAGRRSDGTLLRLSDLKSVLTQHARGMDGKRRLLYGDPAYTPYNGTWLMAGFKKVRKLTPLEESFNKEMSRYRQCAEWSFGKLANIFPFFDFKKRHRLRLSPVGRWFLVGVLLTNAHTCLYLSETSRFFGIYPPSLSEYFK